MRCPTMWMPPARNSRLQQQIEDACCRRLLTTTLLLLSLVVLDHPCCCPSTTTAAASPSPTARASTIQAAVDWERPEASDKRRLFQFRYGGIGENATTKWKSAASSPERVGKSNSATGKLNEEEKYLNNLLPDLGFTNSDTVLQKAYNVGGRKSAGIVAAEARSRRLPEAIIIGVKKGGTRALLEFLKVHPDVRAPGPEIHFFDRHYNKGLEWYRSRMPATLDSQMTIEKTPSYFVTRAAPRRVHSMSPTVRLVVVVRDPVTRALSDYTQALVKRPDLPPFERMAFSGSGIGSEDHRRTVNASWGAIRIGLYARHLDRWRRFFPPDRFHFVSGERLVDDPAGELGRLQDFLGLKRLVTDKHFYFNATKGFPCLKKSEARSEPRCLGQAKGRSHPVVGQSVLRRLRAFFRPYNRRFYAMTGIDFGWS